MTTPRLTTGAEVSWNSPGQSSCPVSSLTAPPVPRSAQGTASAGIEHNDSGVVGAHQYARAAGRVRCKLVVDPPGDAAAIVAVGRPLFGADLGVVAPFLHTAAGVERDHLLR